MTRTALFFLFGIVTVLVAGLFSFPSFADPDPSYLPGDGAGALERCSDSTLSDLFCSLGNQFNTLPSLFALFSWVIAVVLVMTGLLNLKAYGDDPTAVPLRSIIIKFVLAAMLITLPGAIQIVVGSVTNKKSVDGDNQALQGRPCLVQSNLMSLRKSGSAQSACSQ